LEEIDALVEALDSARERFAEAFLLSFCEVDTQKRYSKSAILYCRCHLR